MSAAIHRNITDCHPELAAKSVETKSKRDFMPLSGVSGSDTQGVWHKLRDSKMLNTDDNNGATE